MRTKRTVRTVTVKIGWTLLATAMLTSVLLAGPTLASAAPTPTEPIPTEQTPTGEAASSTSTPLASSGASESQPGTRSPVPDPNTSVPSSPTPAPSSSAPKPASVRIRAASISTLTLWSAPSSLVMGTGGTASARLYPAAAGVQGYVEVAYKGGWARISSAKTDASGIFTAPLSYGVNSAGTYTFRLSAIVAGAPVSTRTWALTRTDIYTTPGTHTVGATRYRTACGNYTATIRRCRTDVYGLQVGSNSSGFYHFRGWRLVQYTHTTVTAGAWRGSYLVSPGVHVVNGKLWRVECGTARSGARACVADQWQSYISTVRNDGSGGYNWQVGWVFQMVLPFSTAPLVSGTATRARVPSVWTNCTVTLQSKTLTIGRTEHTRIVVDQTSGSYATVGLWFRDRSKACSFIPAYITTGRIGGRGVSDPVQRRAGDNTTPAGTYTMTEAHGHVPNPGAELPYKQTTWNDYWVWDQKSPYFNTLRDRTLGGFNTAISQRVRYLSYFEYVLVVNYNRRPVVDPALGGGIRFHLTDGKPTGGCIAVGMTSLKQTMLLVMPGDKITITR